MSNIPTNDSDKAKASILGAGTLTAVARATSQGSQLIIFIFAARALTPADFGVFALVSACAMLLVRLAEAGWAEYIMAWHGDEVVPKQVFSIALMSGAATMIVGLILTAILHIRDVSPELVQLSGLFSIWILLATATATLTGVLVWQERLKQSAIVYLIGELAGLVVAIAALQAGHGVLSLIYGRLTHQVVQLSASVMFSRMLPARRVEKVIWLDVRNFCAHILASRVISNIRMYASTFIIGGFLGPAAVGYFRAAQRLVGAFGEIIGEPTRILAWNMFRRARDEGDGAFNRLALVFFPVLLIIAIPVFFWIAIFADELTIGLLGEKWAPAAPVIVVLAFAQLAIAPSFATEAILSLAGYVRKIPAVAALNAAISIGVTFAAAPMGVMAVAISQFFAAFFFLASSIWMQKKYAGVRWDEIILAMRWPMVPIVISTVALIVLATSSLAENWHPILRVVALSLPVMVMYLGMMAILFRSQIREVWGQVSWGRSEKSI